MDVSILIVNYHAAELIADCIRSVREHCVDLDYEILVVDNDSKQEERARFSQLFSDQVSLIPAEENLGFGKANNLGAKIARGTYLFLLNPDTILINNAPKLLVGYLEDHPEVGVVGGNLYSPTMEPTGSYSLCFDRPEEERRASNWSRILQKKFLDKKRTVRSLPFEKAFNYGPDPIPVAYVFGADMMIRKDLFEELGGFDPEFFMYAEEEELSWRITQAGYAIYNVPQARIVHLEGATTKSDGSFNERQFRMRMNGKLLYYRKCFGTEGMESFYSSRKLQYRRLLTLAKLRGRDPKLTQTCRMLSCLEDEYRKLHEKIRETEINNG